MLLHALPGLRRLLQQHELPPEHRRASCPGTCQRAAHVAAACQGQACCQLRRHSARLAVRRPAPQTRAYPRTAAGKRTAIRFGAWDSCFSLTFALLVNAAILILAAAAFFYRGNKTVACAPPPPGRSPGQVQSTQQVPPSAAQHWMPRRFAPAACSQLAEPLRPADISDAYNLISGAVGSEGAKILFAVALLASGQNATITGTLAGQVRALAADQRIYKVFTQAACLPLSTVDCTPAQATLLSHLERACLHLQGALTLAHVHCHGTRAGLQSERPCRWCWRASCTSRSRPGSGG